MAQQIKGLASKPGDLSSNWGLVWWKEKANPGRLSSDLNTHTHTHTHRERGGGRERRERGGSKKWLSGWDVAPLVECWVSGYILVFLLHTNHEHFFSLTITFAW